MTEIPENILSRPAETAMMMVPCFLYFVQNNLLLVAVASLDPLVYYVVSQLKILDRNFFDRYSQEDYIRTQVDSAVHAHFGNRHDSGEFRLRAEQCQFTGTRRSDLCSTHVGLSRHSL
jgi:hypothetical protein